MINTALPIPFTLFHFTFTPLKPRQVDTTEFSTRAFTCFTNTCLKVEIPLCFGSKHEYFYQFAKAVF